MVPALDNPPGTHSIVAIGRNSKPGAQKLFVVHANWAQLRNGVLHKGFNPFENVLNPTYNISNLTETWVGRTGASITASSPAVVNGVVYVGSDDG